MASPPYAAGLHRLSANTWVYLQPPGTWGYSNCGLVTGGNEAVLIDTQFTRPLTTRLTDAIADRLPHVWITTVVNTHSNGDHAWGNQLFPRSTIVSSRATAAGMAREISPDELAELIQSTPDETPLGRYLRRYFGEFDFSGITVTEPTCTFAGEMDIDAGGAVVRLIEAGPAHTDGDVVAYVPDDGVLFAGDLLFMGDHPIMWAGPVTNWLRACDRIVETGAGIIVPGHGPVTDAAGVKVFRAYLEYVAEQVQVRYSAGMPYWQAAADIAFLGHPAGWGHPERLVITAAAIYRELGCDEPTDLLSVLTRMSEVASGFRAGL
jgi:cyclase